jgi:hypothetical protein
MVAGVVSSRFMHSFKPNDCYALFSPWGVCTLLITRSLGDYTSVNVTIGSAMYMVYVLVLLVSEDHYGLPSPTVILCLEPYYLRPWNKFYLISCTYI